MSDEWIKHDGGPCPVPPQTWVQVKDEFGTMHVVQMASRFRWSLVKAYRIFAPVSATPPADADEAFIRDTAARVFAAMISDGWYDVDEAVRHAEALAAKLKERKA